MDKLYISVAMMLGLASCHTSRHSTAHVICSDSSATAVCTTTAHLMTLDSTHTYILINLVDFSATTVTDSTGLAINHLKAKNAVMRLKTTNYTHSDNSRRDSTLHNVHIRQSQADESVDKEVKAATPKTGVTALWIAAIITLLFIARWFKKSALIP